MEYTQNKDNSFYQVFEAMFGCKTSDQIWTESLAEKDAFLPNLVRVCGFVKARAFAISRLQNETETEI